jgi:hypothetical protein
MSKAGRKDWVKDQKSELLEKPNGAELVVAEAKRVAKTVKTAKRQKTASEQVTYLVNQQHRMNYQSMRKQGLPIGSGTVEAGCKTLIKQRLGGSGMRWLNCHSDDMLIIRLLKLTTGRWRQYWDKKMRYAA